MGKQEIIRDEKGRVVKGSKLNPQGRTGPNRLTTDMKTMIEEAAKRAGERVQKKKPGLKDLEPGTAYLADQAEQNPVAFLGLMRGLLPAKIDLDVTVMRRELVEVLHKRRDQLAELRTLHEMDEIEDAEVIEDGD